MKTKQERQIAAGRHRHTSIGRGPNSRPSNKHKRRSWKKYRGQGR